MQARRGPRRRARRTGSQRYRQGCRANSGDSSTRDALPTATLIATILAPTMSALGQKRTLFTVPLYVCFTPESGHLSAWGSRNYHAPNKKHYRAEKKLSPRIGTFWSDWHARQLDRPLPALLSLLHGLHRGIPGFGYLRGDMLLDVMLGHCKLYGLTSSRQRFLRL